MLKVRSILMREGFQPAESDSGGVLLLRGLLGGQELPIHISDFGPEKIALDTGDMDFKLIERSPKKLRAVSNIAHSFGVAVQYQDDGVLTLRKTQKLSTMDDPEVIDHISDLEGCFKKLNKELGLTLRFYKELSVPAGRG